MTAVAFAGGVVLSNLLNGEVPVRPFPGWLRVVVLASTAAVVGGVCGVVGSRRLLRGSDNEVVLAPGCGTGSTLLSVCCRRWGAMF